jgi:hypothetical protein
MQPCDGVLEAPEDGTVMRGKAGHGVRMSCVEGLMTGVGRWLRGDGAA